ncbi:MAG: rpsD [Parcubacteria group bacterium]|nr:rpsD [Parcubacteria group bacterium]
MKTGPRYKIARRVGAPIYEKTQTPRFAMTNSRKEKAGTMPTRPKSQFGQQLLEKQKARFTYGVTEKQFSKYAKKALLEKDPVQSLFRSVETRLDNTLYRAGFAKTRLQARQAASHGHVTVNGRRVTIPSMIVKENDVVGIREGSSKSALFQDVEERQKGSSAPSWIKVESSKREATVTGLPTFVPTEAQFDLAVVLEYYSR